MYYHGLPFHFSISLFNVVIFFLTSVFPFLRKTACTLKKYAKENLFFSVQQINVSGLVNLLNFTLDGYPNRY